MCGRNMKAELEKGAVKTNRPAKKTRERGRRRKQKARAAHASAGDGRDAPAVNGRQMVFDQIEVEYVAEKVELTELQDEKLTRKVSEKFSFIQLSRSSSEEEEDEEEEEYEKKVENAAEEEEEVQDAVQKEKGGLSNKKKKLERRMKIAELKLMVSRPEVVEVWDATSADPKLLVFLKSYRNTVPVPGHWCQKRDYLRGKRGIEKRPFQLPHFIAATGIDKIRQAYAEKDKKLKHKQRETMQPKMGNMDIDYQVLHDAFFRYQTKPKLTKHGDVYHEGKEFEVKLMRDMKPGMLSQKLKEVLGMPQGVSSPPPWLINMQRYGPPPSYPYLKIPGINAPIPNGAFFGYHVGGWGNPPVDELGHPLYGDVFGEQPEQPNYEEEPEDKTEHWGDLEEVLEEEEEDVEFDDELDTDELMEDAFQSVDSLSSTPTGVETAADDVINLRKKQRNKEEEEPEKQPLYQVLGVKEERVAPGTLFGTSHTYVISGDAQDRPAAERVDLLRGHNSDSVDVSLNPEDLQHVDNVLPVKYEEAREQERPRSQREDFSHMVAQYEKKRKQKMQEKDRKSKNKDFKF